jgi:hypothetical protein
MAFVSQHANSLRSCEKGKILERGKMWAVLKRKNFLGMPFTLKCLVKKLIFASFLFVFFRNLVLLRLRPL